MDAMVMPGDGWLPHLWDTDVTAVIQDAEGIQQPYNDADHDHNVEDFFDLTVHRDVIVDQPEQHADDNQGEDEGNQ
jgi:hypothetical protein